MALPLVSILIPAFNAERTIAYTVQSALDQTWSRKEIIVVDDGSTDCTASLLGRFSSRELSIIRQDNQGAAAARNKALAVCHGDYIQWLDADDLLAPTKIARQMEVLQEANDRHILWSSAWGMFINRPYKAKFVPTALWCDLTSAEWLIRKMEQNLYMQTATWLVSRELSGEAGPWNTSLLGDDDGEYFSRVIMKSNGIRFVRESRVFYRMPSAANLSYVGSSDRKLEAQFRSMELTIRNLRSIKDTERVRSACVTYLQNWVGNFMSVRPDLVQRFNQVAASLGGELTLSPLPWKYAWMQPVFGWHAARMTQRELPRLKWRLVSQVDRLLWVLEGRNVSTS